MSVLEQIFEHKRGEVAASKARIPLVDLKQMAADAEPPRPFRRALAEAPGLALIAEIKKASPSKGIIRESFDPREIALSYERAGAHCLSVLTDERFFQGSAENLRIAQQATGLPCLRKDFLDDPYQLVQARAWGADAVLLIVAALSAGQLQELYGEAKSLGMDVLVEVHDEQEACVALETGCDLIGVNNRNLSDFSVSLGTSERLLPLIAPNALAVSESALETRADLDRVQASGAKAVLIGTTFSAAPDIEAKVREVMAW
jgi:indole-3-glycerol phosphate synthase